ncbi:MAG: DUF4339 domain-containing protein [Deltaproteobacteria bacterium]
MSDRLGQTQLKPALSAPADLGLEAYTELDDVATCYLETPRPPAAWLVQVSLFDRPWMTREQLLDELQNGLVQGSTLVWRAGMGDWCAVSQVDELRRALPLHLLSDESSPRATRARSRGVAWLCGATALLTLSVTLYALSAAGVFDTSARAERARPSTVAASVGVR